MEKLLIIDGNSLVNRAYYALPLLTNDKGEYSNAVYGFVNILVKFIVEQKPDYIAVAFDHSRHTFRTDIYQNYKGTRKEMPVELRAQMPILKNLLTKMNINIYEFNGIEADDIIGTISKNSGVKNIILSGDRDVLQLVDDNTEVWLTKKGITDVQMVNLQNIQELFGVTPKQIIDLKSLMGDVSDNIPGVKGVGEKTAKSLIAEYTTLDGVYQNLDKIKGKLKENLIAGKKDAYLSYTLATIKTDCDFKVDAKEYNYDFPFNDEVREIFKTYQFKSLLKRSEIFLSDIQTETQEEEIEVEENRIELKSKKQLDEILATQSIDFLAFNFLKGEFSINDKAVYFLPEQTDLFSMLDLTFQDILNSLKPLFENESITKITYDLKAHMHLSELLTNIKGDVFDIAIMEYLVHAGEKIGKFYVTQNFDNLKNNLLDKIKQYGLEFVYTNIEMPLTKVLFEMEQNGFYINKDSLKDLLIKYKQELDVLTRQIYNCAYGEFNLNSPKQVANVLFEVLGLDDSNNKKHSTSIEYLNMLKDEHRIVPLLIRYRKIQKLYSSYLEPYTKLVQEKGECIHTIFNQTLTATGRLSSSEPNLQNIPIREEEGKNLRKIFVSRFENGQLVSADYSQIELRLLASFSNDENLIKAYVDGEDIHKATASQIFDKPICEISDSERSYAKAVNFGIIYGISVYGLSNQIGESKKVAKYFLDKYLNTYPKVTIYMNDNIAFAQKNGYSKTVYGRIRKINELASSNKNIKQFGERVAMNMPLQGSASDIIKLAMIKVNRELKRQKLQSKLILQIHDELIIDAPGEEVEKVKQILSSCMENVITLKVPLIVNISSGKTWFDAK